MRASAALRCVPARRVLKLSRINGFHLYDLLHAQQFLLVRVFGKKGKLTGLTKQDKKKDILQFLLVLAELRAICTTRRRASRHRRYHLNQRSPYFRW